MFSSDMNGESLYGGRHDQDSINECGTGFAPTLYPIESWQLEKTGLMTEKAVMFLFMGKFEIWMPKSQLSKPHFNHIKPYGVEILKQNIKRIKGGK